jgi:hypothetical protein
MRYLAPILYWPWVYCCTFCAIGMRVIMSVLLSLVERLRPHGGAVYVFPALTGSHIRPDNGKVERGGTFCTICSLV